MTHALLLSAGFEPIKILPWKKAVTLVLLEKVEVLEAYSVFIHSPSVTLALPAVVKLNRFIKPIPRRVKFSRQNLFHRDNYTCQYCHKNFTPQQLTYDHVVPRSRGGKTSWTNIVTSCKKCNLKKGNKPLSTFHYPLLKQPVEPSWTPQIKKDFQINETPMVWQLYLSYADQALQS